MRFFKSIIAVQLFMMMLVLSSPALAGQIRLSWKAPKSPPNFAKYRIYWSEKRGHYKTYKSVRNNQTSVTISNLQNKKTYYFVATTITKAGKESKYSNEVSVYLDADSDKDGILDREERNIYGTNPNQADTDNDGISDKDEIALWKNAWNKDADGDGKINLQQFPETHKNQHSSGIPTCLFVNCHAKMGLS